MIIPKSTSKARTRARLFLTLPLLAVPILGAGCQMLTYTGPNGERISRSSLGANIWISSLAIEADTNGLRRVEMQGYQNDSGQALGAVTEAAVRAAIQSAR